MIRLPRLAPVFLGLAALAGCAVVPRSPRPGEEAPVATPAPPELASARRELVRAWALADAGRVPEALAGVEDVLFVVEASGTRTPGREALREAAVKLWMRLQVPAAFPEDEPLEAIVAPPLPWWTGQDLGRPEVERWRRWYLDEDPHGVQTWIDRIGRHVPLIQAALRDEGLPADLWVLTLVESGGESEARSRSGAVGPWQIVPETARYLGLILSPDRDQRRDWIASTRAAGHYLRELHEEFADGLLAMAAFNCGPGRVRRELARSSSGSFWELRLPPETRRHVPRILALADLVTGPDATFRPREDSLAYDTVDLPYPVRVADLAGICAAETGDLEQRNPAWLHDVTPGDGHPARARVPAGTGERVTAALAARELEEAVPASARRVYRVRRGDTLWGIARRHGSSLKALLSVNGFTGREVIRPGQQVLLPP